MFQAASTEARGWLEALTDRSTLLTLLWRALCAALCAAGALAVAGTTGAPAAVLGIVLAVLGINLALLRVRHRL
jgi:hypothetical protein